MRLLFVHGWGFGADIWDALAAQLSEFSQTRLDRGYFGPVVDVDQEGPFIAVAHSFGAMRVLRDPPGDCRGLIAINGFERFAARGELPGVPTRLLDRMIARFAGDPVGVLAEFRRRCGSDAPFGEPDKQRLIEDLAALRDGDCSAECAAAPFPILSLQGAADPLMPPAMREVAFSAAPHLERRTHPTGGHLLPQADSAYCARAIRAFVEHWS